MKHLKYIVILLSLLMSGIVISQETTVILNRNDVFRFLPNDTTYAFSFIDTISADAAPDTIISGGDTLIFDFPDTMIYNFPHVFSSPYEAVLSFNMDTIQNFTDLTGSVQVRTARCSNCRYTTAKTISFPNVDTYSSDTLEIKDLYLQLRMIGTAGIGSIESTIVAKPKGSW